MTYETVWSFNTARYSVNLDVCDEDMSPTDGFCEQDDVDFASEGGWHWFQARVQVVFRDDDNPINWAVQRDQVLGEDYLGGCSYHGLADFKSGGYFHDMVSTAVDEARGKLGRMSADMRVVA